MTLYRPLLAITLIVSTLQVNARTFEIVFDVNVDQRYLGFLQPYDPATSIFYPGIDEGELSPHWTIDNSFSSPQQFQFTISFSDSSYSIYETTDFRTGELTEITFGDSPFSAEINSTIPESYGLNLNYLYPYDHFLAQQEISSGKRSSRLISTAQAWHTEYDLEQHKFSQSKGLIFNDPENTLSNIENFESIDGFIAFFTTLQAENKNFQFFQGWSESHYYNTAPEGEHTVDPSFTYFNGVSYQGSATIASINEVSEVPVPAAAWLIGSGLLSLFGIAKRRK